MNKNKSSILIVDDTETNIDILIELLSEYEIAVAIDGESAMEILAQEKPDLILLDIMMPNMDGYEVCENIKANEDTQSIPVIFITARTDEDAIERAYEVGGVDYVTKPFKPRELLARVKTQLKVNKLIQHLEFIAAHDEMTGILNRRKFFDLAKDKFQNEQENLYAVMIDIDRFKDINDSYGHSFGDLVIKLVATTISEKLNPDDIFGRIGGEEFALLCNRSGNIVDFVEGIREAIDKLEIYTDNGVKVTFTISEGIAKHKENILTIDELLKIADKALYEAKGDGRNKVMFR